MSDFKQTDRAAAALTPPGGAAIDSLLGRTIEDKYRLDALLGTGGMGTVYRATRLMIGDAVAIKILHSQQVADPQAIERFRREAQAAARLKHQNAITIYDFGVSNEGLVYLVMELAEGQSLRDIIKQFGPVSPSVAAEIMSQVCAALDEAHRQNIVHRDLKPDNIIVAQAHDGLRTKVLDFGIAKMRDLTASNLTQTGSVMGTPYYMSPEQCMGEDIDSRSDVYSLGIVLFEMLAGVVPFNSPTSTAVVVQHVTQAPPSLRALNASIGPAVEAVVLRALEKQREARPQTAGQLAQELYAAAGGLALTPNSGSRPVVMNPLYTSSGPTTPVATPPVRGMAATVQMDTPPIVSGSRAAAKSVAGIGGAPRATQIKSRLPLILVATSVVALIAVAAAFLLWSRREKPEIKTEAAVEKPKTKITPPLNMAYVPGGEFMMGNDAGDEYERPQHKVTVKHFFIDLHEVTNDEYGRFVTETGHRPPTTWAGNQYSPAAAEWPVTGVDWYDAVAYAVWANKRLPTEAEWELAARGLEGRRYPWGNEWKDGAANAGPSGINRMIAVGSFSSGASPYGVFDLVGNAWEWTATDLTAYPGGNLPPAEAVELKVIRGGCYLSAATQATTTFRRGYRARGAPDYNNTGFRCAKDVASD